MKTTQEVIDQAMDHVRRVQEIRNEMDALMALPQRLHLVLTPILGEGKAAEEQHVIRELRRKTYESLDQATYCMREIAGELIGVQYSVRRAIGSDGVVRFRD